MGFDTGRRPGHARHGHADNLATPIAGTELEAMDRPRIAAAAAGKPERADRVAAVIDKLLNREFAARNPG